MRTQTQTRDNGTPPPTMAMPSSDAMDIPIDRIVADDKFNSRVFLTEEVVDEMATSLKRDGQLSPVRVSVRKDGRFNLDFGFRRFHAAKKLGWTTIKATVDTDPELTRRGRMVKNLVENEQRRDLTTYERARRYKEMLEEPVPEGEKPLSQNTLAAMTSLSPSYISRLMSGMEKLHPKLLERWKYDCEQEVKTRGQHTSLINVTSLKELIKYDHDMQLRWLDEAVNGPKADPADEDDEEGDGEEDGDKPNTKPRTSLPLIKAGLKAAKAAREEAVSATEQAYCDGVIAALQFAIRPKKVQGVFTIADGKVKPLHGKEAAGDDEPAKDGKKAAKK